MPWFLGAAMLVTLGLSVQAAAEELPAGQLDSQPLVIVSRALELPDVERVPRKTRKNWLQSVSEKLESARSAMQTHQVVVTSDAAGSQTLSYNDIAQSFAAAKAKLGAVAAEPAARRIDLGLSAQPSRERDMKVEVTGGADAVGVLVSKKM
jgi:hypothetical protein